MFTVANWPQSVNVITYEVHKCFKIFHLKWSQFAQYLCFVDDSDIDFTGMKEVVIVLIWPVSNIHIFIFHSLLASCKAVAVFAILLLNYANIYL